MTSPVTTTIHVELTGTPTEIEKAQDAVTAAANAHDVKVVVTIDVP
jgi:hypothetical protein